MDTKMVRDLLERGVEPERQDPGSRERRPGDYVSGHGRSGRSRALLLVTTVPMTLRAFLLPLATHFRRMGWRVDAAAAGVSRDAACIEGFDRLWDIEWSRRPFDPSNLLTAPRRMSSIVELGRYDLVHVHTPIAAFSTRLALRSRPPGIGPRVVYTAHGFHFHPGGRPLANLVYQLLERVAGRWTDYLVVINEEDEAAARRYRFLPGERIRHMPGIGVDRQRYSPKAVREGDVRRLRSELGLGEHDVLIVTVGELILRKRQSDVLQALAALRHPRVHLALVGDGPLLAPLRDLANSLGISSRVHFTGFRQDVPILLRGAVATVLASEHEGLPRSVMESLCLEVPVIGSDVRGTRELLRNGSGLLVQPHDVQGLARAIRWVIEHAEEARAMGRRGRERMAPYDIANILVLHEQLYAEALGLGSGAALNGQTAS